MFLSGWVALKGYGRCDQLATVKLPHSLRFQVLTDVVVAHLPD